MNLVRAVRKVEWVQALFSGNVYCYYCGCERGKGHAPECEFARRKRKVKSVKVWSREMFIAAIKEYFRNRIVNAMTIEGNMSEFAVRKRK